MNSLVKTLQYFLLITAELTVLLIGISAIVSLVLMVIPQEKLRAWLSKRGVWENFLGAGVGAATGIPLVIRAETAIPIGLALAQKGMSMGAVIALIIGGAGMAIPEMTMLAGIFRKQLVAAIVVVIFATAVIGGYVFNLVA